MGKRIGKGAITAIKVALISILLGFLTVFLPILFFIVGVGFIILMLLMWC